MLSMWAFLKESDVEAYLASVVLPSYLSHLRLRPFQFSWQSTNCDGQEALTRISHRPCFEALAVVLMGGFRRFGNCLGYREEPWKQDRGW